MKEVILMSFQSTPAFNIMTLLKSLELRTRVPKDYVGWIYGYVTKAKPYLHRLKDWQPEESLYDEYQIGNYNDTKYSDILNGTIPFRFWFDESETIYYASTLHSTTDGAEYDEEYKTYKTPLTTLLKNACLNYSQLEEYGKEKDLYAMHIKKLEIFDKPMELGEFCVYKRKTIYSGMDCPPYVDEVKTHLYKAPQSYQFVCVNEVGK